MTESSKHLIETRLEDFRRGRLNCAETVLTVLCGGERADAEGISRIATPFGGGLCGRQDVCGALTGALMAIGLRYGRRPGGDKDPAYDLGEKLLAWFEKEYGAIRCAGLTGADFSDPKQNACFRAEGGARERICIPLVTSVCGWLEQNL